MHLRKTAVALVFLAAAFFAWNYLRPATAPLPCEKPIAYTIGAFDRRFGISHEDFLGALRGAEAVWEKPSGIELFVYAPERGQLAVNLIYDSRQETTGTLSGLESVVEKNETTYNLLQTRYARLKTEYDSAKNVYDKRAETFNEKNTLYQNQIETWNAGKRTSREQFGQLEVAKKALETEVVELKILEAQLNERAREINALVGMLNRLARSLNLSVETYNTIGASRGETFIGGIYYSAEGDRGIDIYEFSNREKLVRIMAHELGHALGLEHVDDSQAIMYRLNEGDAGILTRTDLTALEALCGVK